MDLSLTETATLLGKNPRQVRYLIKAGRLKAAKKDGRWRVSSTELLLSDAQRQALAARTEVAREAFEKGLEPVAKAVLGSASKKDGETRRRYSVTYLGHRVSPAGIAPIRDVLRRMPHRLTEVVLTGDAERVERSAASYRGVVMMGDYGNPLSGDLSPE